MKRLPALLLLTLLLGGCDSPEQPAATEPVSVPAATPVAAPAQPLAPPHPERVLFGDLHIHTSFSPDAFAVGNRTQPDDAYRFAKGEQTLHAAGYPVQLHRALDFAAVTDHAEYMGVLPQLADPQSPLSKLPLAARFMSADPGEAQTALTEVVATLNSGEPIPELVSPQVTSSVWQQIVAAANRHDAPGTFTALVGYEWTSTIDGNNLHRNVIFRSDTVPERPFSSFDSPDPERLWAWLEEKRAAGIDSLAIPHNQNASNGLMFGTRTFDGRPFDADYVSTRMRNEPVHEIIQIKGQSEVHPALAPNDEFANFEIFPITLKMGPEPTISQPAGSYVREALGVGLELDASGIGNPYRFSFIGSSDSHNSTSPIEEDNYHGKLPLIDGTPEQRLDIKPASELHRGLGRIMSAQGLAAVWATGNTREAIFDALRRGETYATSGPRIGLRVFGGWGYEQALLGDAAYLDKAYAGGVPMGGDLPARPADAGAPRLLIRAAKDPDGANLDRVQVIKGWLDADGQRQEKIFEVAWSGERALDPVTGKLPAVGSTVEVAAASYTNTIGAAALEVLWEDPEFDPARRAFYYVRVLEIPTPRWSTHDAAKLKVAAPEPQVLQERAYSSPFWYEPAGA
ncbi:MAG: DUF3604 domain-containing protein [Pseudomonadales bacterium]|nr:DUF3604 domain-containing protein [Pseudomonadales bacterium]